MHNSKLQKARNQGGAKGGIALFPEKMFTLLPGEQKIHCDPFPRPN